MDDELLQDFLVEAGEILEELNEQLIELENSPDDMDLLNTVFRGFHTIKGGAGFLEIPQMVEICHRAEDVFNLLRNGERQVNALLMDSILPVVDVLNDQFECLRNGDDPPHAEAVLLTNLENIITGESIAEPAPAVTEEIAVAPTPVETTTEAKAVEPEPVDATIDAGATTISNDTIVGGGEDISDEEFEVLLNVLQNPASDVPVAGAGQINQNEDITDEEFEQILDKLHGEGQSAGSSEKAPPAKKVYSPTDGDITEGEFDQLLDELHGKGKFNTEVSKTETATPQPTAAPQTATAYSTSGDEITEEEFDKMLDDLHGEGKFNSAISKSDKPVSTQTTDKKVDATTEQAVAKTSTESASKSTAQTPAVETEAKQDALPAKTKPAASKDKAASQAETTVRVDTKRLDDIMNMVGELVLVRNRIGRLGADLADEEMVKAVANLDLVTSDLQMSVMKTRMQPIKKVFGRFPRVVRDIARNLKKEIRLEMEGEDTDLDKNLVDALADPLVHLVRNSVDHGIEMPDERVAAGKLREGRVLLKAEQEGDHILLVIEDDGKGMDPVKLREIAVNKGMMDADAAARLSDNDAYNLILAPGFSTKEEISDISGRGVGMDVVKTRISQLNGTIEIDSTLGKGSRISIKLPLTLAIMPTLMVQLEEQLFALPLVSVNEIFHLDLTNTNIVDNQLCVVVRGHTLPLFYLNRWLVKGQANADLPQEGHVVVVHVGNQKVGFVVDQLIGQEEVVIKPLGALLHGTEGLAGATITGDGGIALILDVPGLLNQYARHAA